MCGCVCDGVSCCDGMSWELIASGHTSAEANLECCILVLLGAVGGCARSGCCPIPPFKDDIAALDGLISAKKFGQQRGSLCFSLMNVHSLNF